MTSAESKYDNSSPKLISHHQLMCHSVNDPMVGDSLTGLVGPTSPWEDPEDEVIGHIRARALRSWTRGLNLMATLPPNLVLWPNVWPSANFKHCHPLVKGLRHIWRWSELEWQGKDFSHEIGMVPLSPKIQAQGRHCELFRTRHLGDEGMTFA